MSEFLGPYGQATVILMKSHFGNDLPKLRDLKKILNITDGKFYKSDGRFSPDVRKLKNLLDLVADIRGEQYHWNKHESDEFLVTTANVQSNLFMMLKFNAQVIEGFNLTTSCLDDLDKLKERYSCVCSMRSKIEWFWSALEDNSQTAAEKGINDASILKPDISSMRPLLKGYGDEAYEEVTQALIKWHETYRWKVGKSTIDESDDIKLVAA